MRNRFTVRRALLAAAFLLAPVGLVAGASPASAAIPGPAPVPLPGVCTSVPEVKSAELVRTVDGPAILVTGIKAHTNSKLFLEPEDIDFVVQPEYFPYLVNECGTGPVTKTPFTEVFRVPTNPVGRFGIDIQGILVDLFPHHLPADA